MTEPQGQVTWLTQEAFDRLTAELEQLSGPGREAVVSRIAAAREEGDLKENGGYHAAKEEQGKLEARIRQLQQMLRSAQVGEAPDTGGVVAAGCVVTVRFAGDDEDTTFLLGSREEGATASLDVYSPQSPLGTAVTGSRAGDTVTYELANGRSMSVEVIDVKPYSG